MTREEMVQAAMDEFANSLDDRLYDRLVRAAELAITWEDQARIYKAKGRSAPSYLDALLVGLLFGEMGEVLVELARTKAELEALHLALAAIGIGVEWNGGK